MRTFIVSFILLLVCSSNALQAQTVTPCVTANGVPIPVNRQIRICQANTVTPTTVSSAVLDVVNCAAVPNTNIKFGWRNLDVAPFTDSTDGNIRATTIGRWKWYIVNLANLTDTMSTDTVFVSYHPPISITLNTGTYSLGTHGCRLSTYNLTTSTTGAISSYQWFTYAPKIVVPGVTSSSYIIPYRDTVYIVNATDANGCVASDTSNITFASLPTMSISLGPDPTVFCEGNTYNLTVQAPSGYGGGRRIEWGTKVGNVYTMIGFINNPPLPPPIITDPPAPITVTPPAGSTQYYVRLFGPSFVICTNEDEITITTRPIPVVDLGASPIFACYGESKTLTANVTLGTAPYTYTWSPSPPPSNSSTNTINPTATGSYTVQVTDVNNCGIGSDNVLVNVNPKIDLTTSGNITICKDPLVGTTLVANFSGGNGTFSTLDWSPTTNLGTPVNTSSSSSVFSNPTTTTTYKFKAIDGLNCSDSVNITVTSYEPDAAVSNNGEQVLANNTQTVPVIISETKTSTLSASSTVGGATFSWYNELAPSNILSSDNGLYNEYQGPDTNKYVLVVTDPNNNCQNRDTIAIWSISDNTLLYVPNVFSPNAENPTNQKLRIYGDNILPEGFKIVVYNKWGNLMYETTNLEEIKTNGWDGTNQPEGVYSYFISGKFKNGKDVTESPFYKGTFSLLK